MYLKRQYMASRKSIVGEWLAAAQDDMLGTVTMIQRWYHHGDNDNILSEQDRKGIEAIELAYKLLTDSTGYTNRMGIFNKLKAVIGITAYSELTTLVQIADAIYLTNRPEEKRFKKAAIEQLLMRNIIKAEEADDFKAVAALSKQYIELLGLDKDIDDRDNPVIETIIQLEANPELLGNYNAEDRKSIILSIKRLELKAKQKVTGQE